jgi:release factor glutamine methyltransferase
MKYTDQDLAMLIRDKYEGVEPSAVMLEADKERLASGEPLAYVIGWIPFLGLRIRLDSYPLIPRPETEWWTNELIAHLRERFENRPFRFLDLCAGSGAIGLAILKEFPNAHVSFGELVLEHASLIATNIAENNLDAARADIRTGNLFEPFVQNKAGDGSTQAFDIIATNPPYIPEHRALDTSVTAHEPPIALFAGEDGLGIINQIAVDVRSHLAPNGELWMECDISNIEKASNALVEHGAAHADIRTDQYGRQRFLVAYYS